MVNEKQITDYKVINFFGKTIVRYYDRIFKVVSSDDFLKQDDYFPELRKLHEDLNNGKYDDSTLGYKIRRKFTLV
jgi:DNA invertase Pin-like site-specific DNA recombinase